MLSSLLIHCIRDSMILNYPIVGHFLCGRMSVTVMLASLLIHHTDWRFHHFFFFLSWDSFFVEGWLWQSCYQAFSSIILTGDLIILFCSFLGYFLHGGLAVTMSCYPTVSSIKQAWDSIMSYCSILRHFLSKKLAVTVSCYPAFWSIILTWDSIILSHLRTTFCAEN